MAVLKCVQESGMPLKLRRFPKSPCVLASEVDSRRAQNTEQEDLRDDSYDNAGKVTRR
jgi:hypothetical protein